MATLPLKPVSLYKTTHGGAGEYESVPVTNAQTWINGDLLVRVDGAASLCGADPTRISYLASGLQTDTVPGQSLTNLIRIKPTDKFLMSAYNASPASAVIADSALDGASEYGVAQVTVSGVAAWVLDTADQTATRVRLLARVASDSATDLYPQCIVQFVDSVITFR